MVVAKNRVWGIRKIIIEKGEGDKRFLSSHRGDSDGRPSAVFVWRGSLCGRRANPAGLRVCGDDGAAGWSSSQRRCEIGQSIQRSSIDW